MSLIDEDNVGIRTSGDIPCTEKRRLLNENINLMVKSFQEGFPTLKLTREEVLYTALRDLTLQGYDVNFSQLHEGGVRDFSDWFPDQTKFKFWYEE